MKHSQSHRGRTIFVHAEHRERGYSWSFTVEGPPVLSGIGMTFDDVHGGALCEAMHAARLAIDRVQADAVAPPMRPARGEWADQGREGGRR